MSSAKIYDYTPRVREKTHRQGNTFIRLAVESVYRIAKPHTPRDKGNLSRDVLRTVQGLHGSVEWRKVYAGAQEAGYTRGHKMVNYTTPGTGPHFAVNAVAEVVKNTKEYVIKATRL